LEDEALDQDRLVTGESGRAIQASQFKVNNLAWVAGKREKGKSKGGSLQLLLSGHRSAPQQTIQRRLPQLSTIMTMAI